MRRIFWLAAGLGAGATVALAATRWVRRQADRVAPATIARQAGSAARDLSALLAQASAEFRAGMADKEAEVRASLPG